MEKPKNNTAVPVKSSAKPLKIPRTFEIMVEEMHEEDDGTVRWRPVMIDPRLGGNGSVVITVSSKQELQEKQQWYQQAGQRFKIIREINPPSREDIERMAAEQGVSLPHDISSSSPSAAAPRPDAPQAPHPDAQQAPRSDVGHKTTSKIITLGDVQIKYDGNSVYQKQWVRLSPKEEAGIRVISDANNKIVPMKGRHFEVKRWVKIEGGSVLDETTEEL